jgi:hypothetical protein
MVWMLLLLLAPPLPLPSLVLLRMSPALHVACCRNALIAGVQRGISSLEDEHSELEMAIESLHKDVQKLLHEKETILDETNKRNKCVMLRGFLVTVTVKITLLVDRFHEDDLWPLIYLSSYSVCLTCHIMPGSTRKPRTN